MKILEKDGKYQKVSNDFIAEDKVKKLGWRYATKDEWRKQSRNSTPPTPQKVGKEVNEPSLKKKK